MGFSPSAGWRVKPRVRRVAGGRVAWGASRVAEARRGARLGRARSRREWPKSTRGCRIAGVGPCGGGGGRGGSRPTKGEPVAIRGSAGVLTPIRSFDIEPDSGAERRAFGSDGREAREDAGTSRANRCRSGVRRNAVTATIEACTFRSTSTRSRAASSLQRIDGLIAGLAARQHGVVARRQLSTRPRAAGDRPSGRAGRLHPIHRGVYAVGHRPRRARPRGWPRSSSPTAPCCATARRPRSGGSGGTTGRPSRSRFPRARTRARDRDPPGPPTARRDHHPQRHPRHHPRPHPPRPRRRRQPPPPRAGGDGGGDPPPRQSHVPRCPGRALPDAQGDRRRPAPS